MSFDKQQHIAIAGAGLVGSLLSIYLAKRGFKVSVFERRQDMRRLTVDRGRSINLALSNRGIRALDEVGLAEEIQKVAIPMHGRTMHDRQSQLTFQPYGKEGQFINSVSRSNLNIVLMDKAESLGVKFFFEHRTISVDFDKTQLTFQHPTSNIVPHDIDAIICADGTFSPVRDYIQLHHTLEYDLYSI